MAAVTVTGLPASAPKLSTVALIPAGRPFMKDQDPEVYQAVGAPSGGTRPAYRLSDGQSVSLSDAAAVLELQFDAADLSPA